MTIHTAIGRGRITGTPLTPEQMEEQAHLQAQRLAADAAAARQRALLGHFIIRTPNCMPAGIVLEARTDPNLNRCPHLASPNGRAMFVFQTDGNFVLSTPEGQILWSTKSAGSGAHVLSVQSDGNLVLRTSRDPNAAVLWASHHVPVGRPNSRLVVQDDGNAVLLDAEGNPYWATDSQGFTNRQDEGGWLENVAKDAGSSIEDVGGTALTILYEGTGVATAVNVVTNIADGVRLDKVISRSLEDQVRAARDVAPYVQAVISLVPGIGTGISAAIAGGLALAQGKRIDQALMDAAVGALPGGVLVQSAARAGIAAARGQPIDEVALQALPVSDQQRELVRASLQLAQDVAQGKPVANSLLEAADSGLAGLPPEIRQAVQVGTALAHGENLQNIAISQITKFAAPGEVLERIGQQVASGSSVAAEARNLVPAEAQYGFNLGLGIMQHTAGVLELDTARQNLDPANLKAFDMAIALHVGRICYPSVRPPLRGHIE